MNTDPNRYEESWAEKLNEATSVDGGMAMLMREHANVFYLNGTRIEPMLLRRLGQNTTPPYPLSSFNITLPNLRMPLVIHGDSEIGKTCLALASFKHPLVISDMDDLQLISLETDGLVFDDMCFLKLDPEQVIHLLDINLTRSIHARYKNARIPRGKFLLAQRQEHTFSILSAL